MARLRDICEKRVDTIKTTYEGDIDYIDISSVDNQRKEITQTQSMSIVDAPSRAKQLVYPGDILVSTVRPNLNAVALVTENSDNTLVASTGYCVLRCLPNVDNKYVFYFCQSPDFIEKMVAQATGASYPAVTSAIVKECTIPLPPLKEQRRIAALLDKVSDLIAKRRAQLDKLDLLVKARFVEMFGDPVLNPHGYVVQSLQALIDNGVITYHLDGNHGGDYPRNEEFVDSGVPYIGANCISRGKIDFRLARYLTSEKAGKLKKGIAQNGDVLFAHNATVGPVAVLETGEPRVILSTSLTAYRCNQNVILPNYLKVYMESEGFIRQYSEEMKQTTRNQVPITAQKKYLFLLPPMALQTQFNAFVVQTDRSKLTIQQSLDKLETLKKALMQQYFG